MGCPSLVCFDQDYNVRMHTHFHPFSNRNTSYELFFQAHGWGVRKEATLAFSWMHDEQ